MRVKTLGPRLICCLSIVIAFSAQGCGKRGDSKSRPSQARAGFFVSPTSRIIGDRDLPSNPNVGLGRPRGDEGTEILISRNQNVVAWSPEHRGPNWVAWRLKDSDLGSVRRTNAFAVDPDLERYLAGSGTHAVEPQDFQGSCLDRGHMTPSADRTASTAENRQTFLMSNMVPQTAHLNRVIWESFEEHERNLVRGTDQTIFIIAGSIYAEHPGHIGPNKDIAVPAMNFKILFQAKDAKTPRPTVLAAVLMANTTSTGSDPVTDHEQACADSKANFAPVSVPAALGPQLFAADASITGRPANDEWERYRTSVGEIAQATGLDFSFAQ